MKKYLLSMLFISLFFASCNNTVKILSTGEKVELYVKPYVKGDTIILYRTNLSNEWRVDVDWRVLSDTTVMYQFNDTTLVITRFVQAAIID